MPPVRPVPSLYLDTSVFGGYFDHEFLEDTHALWRMADAGRFRLYASRVVLNEPASAPRHVEALLLNSIPEDNILPLAPQAEILARAYLDHGVLTTAFIDDARHVAVCSLSQLEFLVSWNFRHLANERREVGFNRVNILQGRPRVRIVTPTFLLHGYKEENL
jgi:predicted nucleic acid-binding protein